MTDYRTKRQKEADRIDLEIFRALGSAEEFAVNSQNWRNVVQLLKSARISVRHEMHPNDRKRTET